MKLGITMNELHIERARYTTTRLAMAAATRGHEVFYIGAGDFGVDADDSVFAHALAVETRTFRSGEVLLRSLREPTARRRVCVDDLDVLLLRHNPNEDVFRRPWARQAPLDFGLLAAQHGVIVLNDPFTLATALTKLYLHGFPAEVRPKALVTRDRDEAEEFIADHGGCGVLKPLFGFGGRHVFLVRPEDAPNVHQMFEAVAEDGYVIVQEYLPDAVGGDTRLFLMDGEPLQVNGKVAAVRRVRQPGEGDMRSNISAGATTERALVDDAMLELAGNLRPRLVADGIFLAGVDIVGDKVMEINIMTPGALWSAERLEGEHFSNEVIAALEHKVDRASG